MNSQDGEGPKRFRKDGLPVLAASRPGEFVRTDHMTVSHGGETLKESKVDFEHACGSIRQVAIA